MQREVFVVEKERFDLSDEKTYHLQGTWPKEHTAAAELDGKPLEVNLKQQERISALERFQDLDLVDAIRVQMEIVLPDKLEQYKKLVVYAEENGKKEVWFSIPVKQLIRRQGMPQYFIESSEVDRKLGICRVRGWAAYTKPLKVYLENSRGNRIPCEIQHLKRVDVQNQYPEAEVEEKCGFFFELHYQQLKEFYIVFEAGSIRVRRQIHLQPIQLAAEKINEYCKKGSRYLEMTEGYCTRMALDENNEVIGYEFVNLGKLMDALKGGATGPEAIEKAKGTYGRFADAVKYIDPRKE